MQQTTTEVRKTQAEDATLFRLLVDRITEYAIFLLTTDGHIASWNAGAERLKGYTADEIIGEHFSRFYPEAARAQGRPAQLLAIATSEGRVEDEGWRVRKDGTLFWADVVITALRDDKGELRGFAKITRDMTERRQAEEDRALRLAAERASDRMQRLQSATASLAAATQPQEAMDILVDVVMRELHPATVAFAMPVETGDRLETIALRGTAVDFDALVEVACQTRRPVTEDDTAVIPLLVERLVGVLCVKFEPAAASIDADWRDFLLALAEVGAQAIDRARAYEGESRARSTAEVALRTQDEFLSVAAHELRTPVAAVKVTAQLAERAIGRGQSDAGRMARHLQDISTSADRLGALIEDLLDLSRLRTGRIRVRRRALDPRSLFEGIVEHYRASDDSHEFSFVCHGEPIQIEADPVRLEQVLDNLLSNAVKYSPEGGSVDVALEADPRGATLSVTDEGIGLPPGQETRIFDAFGRGSNAADRQIQGLGLGLSICRHLVEAHGGRIWAASPGEGSGATFCVWLPAAG